MDYNALKVADLKGLLKERGIASTGLTRKQQIIEALESHDASEEGKQVSNDVGDSEAADQDANGAVAAVGDGVGNDETVLGASDEVAEAGNEKEEDAQNVEATATAADVAQDAPTTLPAPEADATQPTVLEANQPVSKEPSALATPRQISPIAESTSSDRKRKRRSLTPPVDEETVSKKLKAADEDVATLPEDGARQASIAERTSPAGPAQAEQTSELPRDDMDIDQAGAPSAHILQVDGTGDIPDSTERSTHPPTRAIYICNLVRPIQPGELSSYLTKLAIAPGDEREHENLEALHLGSIRTHAFAIFNTTATATQVRSRLHGQVWPDEPARRALWVDFVPEDKVQQWMDLETEGSGRRDIRRWEVLYDDTDNGVVARHQEVTAGSGAPERRPSNISTSGNGMGMPNAPLGPRSSRPSVPTIPPTQPAKQTTPNPTSSASFVVLDERFPSTTLKPKLYYLPVTKDLAERRMDELERQTSREWGARGGDVATGEVRRYTFEDGDRIVDGGPHYDDFSGPRGGGGGGRRRGGGGFRGRR